jgi:enoyl-CoA hydratase/carnithine racemase
MVQSKNRKHIVITDVPAQAGGVIRIIELNRPEKLNCLSLEMLQALLAALKESENSNGVILTGVGRSFCTGLDFKEIGDPENATKDSANRHLRVLVEIFRWFLTARIPTVVLARGHAVGGGAGLVACAQTAVVTEDFRCKLPGGHLAKLACVAVSLFKLRASGRFQDEPEPDWLGREFNAREAEKLGLVDSVVSPAHLDDAIRAIKNGKMPPECNGGRKRSEKDVVNTVKDLEDFLRSMPPTKVE